MFTDVGKRDNDQSSNLNKVVCISQSANTFQKDMNPTILPPALGK